MKILIIICLIMIQGSQLWGTESTFKVDVQAFEKATFNDETLLFITHPTKTFDYENSATLGVQKLLKWSKKENIKSLLAVDRYVISDPNFSKKGDELLAEEYYVSNTEATVNIESSSGSHALQTPHLKKLILAGGNMSLCLCESMRDIVRGSFNAKSVQKKSMDIYVVMDAIYDSEKMISKDKNGDFYTVKNLETHFASMNSDEIREYFKNVIFDTNICPFQQIHPEGAVPTQLFQVHIENQGQTWDMGNPNSQNKLNLHLVTTRNLPLTSQ